MFSFLLHISAEYYMLCTMRYYIEKCEVVRLGTYNIQHTYYIFDATTEKKM